MKNTLTLFFFFFFFFLSFLSHEVVSDSLQDLEVSVLLKLKKHWGDLPYMSEWTRSNAESRCQWPGLACDSGSVTELTLVDVDILAPVPDFICDLGNLTVINLGNNYVPGGFPRAVYNCSKLRVLDISNNYFVGTLPGDIDRLSGLETLNIGGNNFTGDFPDAIRRLKNLTFLNLGANLFNASLPPMIGELSNLEVLDLSSSRYLTPSKLPSSYAKLKKLRVLWVYHSNLIGEIPEGIADLESLEKVDLSSNNLTGNIPGRLFSGKKNLTVVYLHINSLSGGIPQVVGSPSLTVVDLSMNKLTGMIPQGFGNLTEMTGLALFTNRLHGTIPEGIGRLPYLQDLRLWENDLSGELPPGLGENSVLKSLQVSSNRLTGKLPESLCQNGSLVGLVINDNDLAGELPAGLGNCPHLLMVKATNNRLGGPLPRGLWTASSLRMLMLANNSFTGTIPEKVSVNLSRIEIGDNEFHGSLPSGISAWKSLVFFDAGNNRLTGPIPPGITALASLTNLVLDRNQLTGNLPSEIESWKSLHTLDLRGNRLSGPIPESLGLLPDLTDLDLSENLLSGRIPETLGHCRFNVLNLSSNNLEGTIPRAFDVYDQSFLDNPRLGSSAGEPRPSSARPSLKTPYLILIVTLSVAAFVLAASFSALVIRCYWSKHGLDTTWKLTAFQKLKFTEANILSGLSEHNLVGSGGSGKVYRVAVSRGAEAVAVKRIVNDRRTEEKLEQEFMAEVKILSSIRHANIVKLLCCLSSESSKLLVYEYLEHRGLDRCLRPPPPPPGPGSRRSPVHHQETPALDWPKRLGVAVGAAQGLAYMHHDCLPPVIHRDIKSSNILLDSEFKAKIADFGLAKLLVKQGELATMSTVAGSFGYMAPEYAQTSRVNEKIDVYSFGVVLLELVTGRAAGEGGEQSSLAEWAWRLVEQGKDIEGALDEDVKEPTCTEEMIWVFKVGIICTSSLPSSRPTMKHVVQLLLRCFRQTDNKFSGLDYDAAPLLPSSKRRTDEHHDFDTIV